MRIMPDAELAAALANEDDREDRGVLAADDRRTCHTHQDWVAHCWPSRLHANRVTGHNWCRACDAPIADCPHRPGPTSD
jgi:hypothetical protein